MSRDDDEYTVTFQVGPDVRCIHDDAVPAVDAALGGVGFGEVMHFIDPQRINAFSSGGPPVWSVGTVATDRGTLYLTYGLSEAIDPQRSGYHFELAIVVPGVGTMWPALLLRALARYMLQQQRELAVGQFMAFPGPLTRFFAAPEEARQYPETGMTAACFVVDPRLPTIATPRGAIEVRRVFGLYADELQRVETWSILGLSKLIGARDPGFVTDLQRPSFARDPMMVAAIERGSAAEGSEFPYVAVPGVRWSHDGKLRVTFPGGAHGRRIHRMLRARLPFGRHLLVHDVDPNNPLAIAFEPSERPRVRVENDVVVLSFPVDHPLIATLDGDDHPEITWTLG